MHSFLIFLICMSLIWTGLGRIKHEKCTGKNLGFVESCQACSCDVDGYITTCKMFKTCKKRTTVLIPNPCSSKQFPKFFDGCTWCTCDMESGAIIKCGSEKCNLEPYPCIPGEIYNFTDGCSVCTCNIDGTIGNCTAPKCIDEPKCKIGDTKQIDCNYCYCGKTGHFVCPVRKC